MTDTLFHAYVPLLLWPGIGLLLFVLLPNEFPRWLGRSLYWVGVPLEIFTLARQTPFDAEASLAPVFTVGALIGGVPLAWLGLKILHQLESPSLQAISMQESSESLWNNRLRQGSFILSSIIGNTGFVGLAIAPIFVSDQALSWVVLYSVTHNIVGTYGLGVWIASAYGRSNEGTGWGQQIRDILTVPTLWAFALGILSRPVHLPSSVETILHQSIQVIIPAALMLIGMRISQIRSWSSLGRSLAPSLIKVLVLPGLVGALSLCIRLDATNRLALVLMAGMPTAFAGLILAEEYDLDRELIAGSILISTLLLLGTLPLWVLLFD